jgi:superfamily II DNA/RNA helicase
MMQALCDLLDKAKNRPSKTIVFVSKNTEAVKVNEMLTEHGIPHVVVASTHPQRLENLKRFREDPSMTIMVTTPVAARGVDIHLVSTVINLELPTDLETFVHQTGRAARYGRIGMSITLVLSRDEASLKTIEQDTGMKFEELTQEIAEKGLTSAY